MNARFKTIALIGKYKNPDIVAPLLRLGQYLQRCGVQVVLDCLTASNMAEEKFPAMAMEEIGLRANLAIVMGGDGTMLNIARKLSPFGVPLVGINQGRLGFLTDLSIDTMEKTLGSMLEGQYIAERRMCCALKIPR